MAFFTGTTASETITGGTEDDYITGDIGNDTLNGGDGNDRLFGGEGNDSLTGGAGFDTLIGDAGSDTLIGDSDGNVFYGGDGFDRIVYQDGSSTDFELFWSTSGDIFVQRKGAFLSDQIAGFYKDVELLTFSDKSINLVSDQSFAGTGGADNFGGYFGNDTLSGLGGNDRLNGSAGNDLVKGDGGSDYLTGSLGNDTLNGGDGNDTLSPGINESNSVLGGPGTDTATYDITYSVETVPIVNLGGGSYRVGSGNFRDTLVGVEFVEFLNTRIDLSTIKLPNTPSAGNDTLNGTAGNDALNALAGNDVLNGFAGSDSLIGGSGIDTMRGGAGNDFYTVSESGDVVSEAPGDGADTIKSSVTRILGANQEDLLLFGAGIINGTGNSLANRITGNEVANLLQGQAGPDTLVGEGGQDTLIGGSTSLPFGKNEVDVLSGGAGADRFVLGVASARLYDNGVGSTAGYVDYALISDFTPGDGDRLQLSGGRGEYFLRPTSPVTGVTGKALHHDSNGDGLFNATDELIAVVRGSGILSEANTIGTALFV